MIRKRKLKTPRLIWSSFSRLRISLEKQMERKMATSTTSGGSGSTKGTSRSSSTREDIAKAMVAEQISQAVQSTSNLLHLMQQSSASQVLFLSFFLSICIYLHSYLEVARFLLLKIVLCCRFQFVLQIMGFDSLECL